MSKSRLRDDIRGSKLGSNYYIESDCDKWSCYCIDYEQGYHHSSSSFNRF